MVGVVVKSHSQSLASVSPVIVKQQAEHPWYFFQDVRPLESVSSTYHSVNVTGAGSAIIARVWTRDASLTFSVYFRFRLQPSDKVSMTNVCEAVSGKTSFSRCSTCPSHDNLKIRSCEGCIALCRHTTTVW